MNLFDPVLNVLKGLLVSDGISQDNTDGSFVISLVDIFVPFLAGCVPNLQLYFAVFNFDNFNFKINPNRCRVADLEIVVTKP